MANWSLPSLTDLYTNFLTYMKERDDDAVRLNDSRVTAATNVPDYSKRWNATSQTFQNWLSAAWANLVLSIAGGGTGATTAAGARTNLSVYSKAECDAAFLGAIDTAQGTMVGTVTLTTEGSYYDCISSYFEAGTWLINGFINIRSYTGTTSMYVDLWNGATQLAVTSITAAGESVEISHCIPITYIATLGTATMLKLRAARTGGTSAVTAVGGAITAIKIA